jgi:uncharacterized alkaline shock family protein YloU
MSVASPVHSSKSITIAIEHKMLQPVAAELINDIDGIDEMESFEAVFIKNDTFTGLNITVNLKDSISAKDAAQLKNVVHVYIEGEDYSPDLVTLN